MKGLKDVINICLYWIFLESIWSEITIFYEKIGICRRNKFVNILLTCALFIWILFKVSAASNFDVKIRRRIRRPLPWNEVVFVAWADEVFNAVLNRLLNCSFKIFTSTFQIGKLLLNELIIAIFPLKKLCPENYFYDSRNVAWFFFCRIIPKHSCCYFEVIFTNGVVLRVLKNIRSLEESRDVVIFLKNKSDLDIEINSYCNPRKNSHKSSQSSFERVVTSVF